MRNAAPVEAPGALANLRLSASTWRMRCGSEFGILEERHEQGDITKRRKMQKPVSARRQFRWDEVWRVLAESAGRSQGLGLGLDEGSVALRTYESS